MRNVDFVLYTSKLCNLRCAYCYELPLLDQRARMSMGQLERLFTHVRTWLDGQAEPVSVRFQWHGGEPLLIPPAYYWAAFELQRRIFSGSIHHLQNTVQSNFTVMDDERVDLLARGFSGVGMSLDLRSGLRVDVGGVDREPKALANLERVLAAGVRPDGITVLSRATLPHLPEIYRFYRDRGLGFRLLPLERGLYSGDARFELGAADILAGLKQVADLWFADDQTVMVQPIVEHIKLLVAARRSPSLRVLHDKRRWEPVWSVDTDGRLFGYTNYLDDAHTLGNVFERPLTELLAGPRREEHIVAAEARCEATCGGCPYYARGCTGYPIAESEVTILDRRADGALECSVTRPLMTYLEAKLIEAGVLEVDGRLSAAMRAHEAGAPTEVRHG